MCSNFNMGMRSDLVQLLPITIFGKYKKGHGDEVHSSMADRNYIISTTHETVGVYRYRYIIFPYFPVRSHLAFQSGM